MIPMEIADNSHVPFIQKVMDDEWVRGGISMGVENPAFPSAKDVLRCNTLVFPGGLICFDAKPSGMFMSAQAHVAFLKGHPYPVYECLRQAITWMFRNTPCNRIIGVNACGRKEIDNMAKGAGMKVLYEEGFGQRIYSIDYQDWLWGGYVKAPAEFMAQFVQTFPSVRFPVMLAIAVWNACQTMSEGNDENASDAFLDAIAISGTTSPFVVKFDTDHAGICVQHEEKSFVYVGPKEV